MKGRKFPARLPSPKQRRIRCLSADLYDAHAWQQLYLNTGQQTIAVRFDKAAIFEKGLDGPHTIRNVLLLEESPLTLLMEMVNDRIC